MSFYFEIWLRGFAKDYLREMSTQDPDSYHPHITLIRPFRILRDEDAIRKKVADFCRGRKPIFFTLEGKGDFDGEIYYVPVTNAEQLLEFNNGLEKALEEEVEFDEKLNDEKILHATVNRGLEIPPSQRIEQYMLRITGIKNKRIWFSYDFVTQEALTREESLDEERWVGTVRNFSEKYGLTPTRKGFQRLKP